MSGAGRRVESELRGFLDKLETDGPTFLDLSGPAIYQLEPAWRTAILCYACHYVGLVLSIPSRSLVWPCPRCGSRVLLIPPPAVLEAPAPVHPRLARRQRLS